VLHTNDAGVGSLRQEILDANDSLDPGDVIEFWVSGTIELASAMPAIGRQLLLDGTSAPGHAGEPVVVLDAGNAGAGVNGLSLATSSSVSMIRRLDILLFSGAGIRVEFSDNVLANNRLGTDAIGELDLGVLGGGGVFAGSGASDHTLGGTVSADANVIGWNGAGVGSRFHRRRPFDDDPADLDLDALNAGCVDHSGWRDRVFF
jgi:hypothetical protein